MDHDRMHDDLRGDIWCFVILGMISLAIAATALVWLTVQQTEIAHLTNQVSLLSHSKTHYVPAQPLTTQHP